MSLGEILREATEAQLAGDTAIAIEEAVAGVLPISGDNQDPAAVAAAETIAAAPTIVAAPKAPPAAPDATRSPVCVIVDDTPLLGTGMRAGQPT